MPSPIEKLLAHTEHLLDGFITLRERYAMLRPMLHNQEVVKNKGSNKQYRGFIIIRNVLFLSCCQLIANLCFDKDDRCPSIFQIITKLENATLRHQLREVYSIRVTHTIGSHDSEMLALLKSIEENEQTERRKQFDNFYKDLLVLWSQIASSKSAQSLEKIRNKVAAHYDVSLINGEYKLFDISSLQLKWDDILETISAMQKIIVLINLIVRNADYSWESLDKILSKTTNDYWVTSPSTS
jgi:AbiU2